MSITKQIVESSGLGFFTFNRKMTYCTNCKKSWFGILNKCPSCSAISTLAFYDRYPSS